MSNLLHQLTEVVVVVGFKTNCPLVGHEPIGGMLSVGVFLRDPSPFLRDR